MSRRIFFADFLAGFFLLIFVGKSAQKNPPGKSPGKSSKIYTTKILRHISADGLVTGACCPLIISGSHSGCGSVPRKAWGMNILITAFSQGAPKGDSKFKGRNRSRNAHVRGFLQIFADFLFALGNQGIWESRICAETAGNRRFSQATGRFLQKRFLPFAVSLLARSYSGLSILSDRSWIELFDRACVVHQEGPQIETLGLNMSSQD